MDARAEPREWFEWSSDAVVALVAALPDDAWERPGLGEWTVRELVAHTLRAWSTLRDYLAEPVPPDDTPVLTAAEYLTRGLTAPGVHAGVAQRARDEVATLGGDPSAAVRDLAEQTHVLVGRTPDWRLVPTRFGVLRLDEYLRTRAFELTVHGLDLARATGLDVPPALAASAVPALGLLAEVAGERGRGAELLAAAAGRAALPPGFTLMS